MQDQAGLGRRSLQTGLALVYFVGALFWSMPDDFPLKGRVDAVFDPAFQWSGLWQGWAMFAPDPREEDIYVTARVEHSNGEVIEINLSRMSEMGLFERYQRERWRKYFNDNLRLDANSFMWPPFAAYLARTYPAPTGFLVSRIELTRHWRVGVKPGESERSWTSYRFYQWTSPVKEPS